MSLQCYFGNEIILKHEALGSGAFESGWHLQSMEYRKIVLIFMELVKKKHSILVGNWFPLDLDLFTSVSVIRIFYCIFRKMGNDLQFLFFVLQIMNFAYRLYAVLV